ncbi:MAG TPA: glutaredoxin [Thermoflexia bacterium]|nr:glutaredoxin [Thermoflexia bacterium]
MAFLNDETRGQVAEMLSDLPDQVRLLVFTKPAGCQYCDVITELLTEVAETSAQVSTEVYDLTVDTEKAAEYRIDKAPAIALVGAQDYGLRFFGLPSNYEFSTLLHGIQVAGHGAAAHLDAQSKEYLATLDKEVFYQVFVTTSCPHCPPAAAMAYDMAVTSDLVNAEVVEAQEFPRLSSQNNVMGVPLNVINRSERVEGHAPSSQLVAAIKRSLR